MREFVLKMQGALFVLAAAACGSFANGYGQNQQQPAGVGAYAYQDSNGNRYGGTYDLGEEDVQNFAQNVPRFSGQEFAGFPPGFPFVGPDFASEFFRSLQQSLQHNMIQHSSVSRAVISFGDGGRNKHRAFPSNPVHQQAALRSVNNAFDNSYSHAGYPNPFQGAYHGFGKENIGNYQHPQGSNSAYAAGAINPQGSRQVASISPGNSNYPNVDVSSRSGDSDNGGNKFYSVSSSSFASSVDQDGKKSETRGAKTIVNDNGRVKEYNVHS